MPVATGGVTRKPPCFIPAQSPFTQHDMSLAGTNSSGVYSPNRISGGEALPGPLQQRSNRKKSTLRIAAWNIRTMQDNANCPERRTAILDRALYDYNIDIVALSETRLPEEGSIQEKNYTFFWKGRAKDLPRHHGVGFAIKNALLSKWKATPTGISERLATLRIEALNGYPINFLSCYGPTLQAEEQVKETYYHLLDTTLNSIPNNESVVLLGDFNARVGQNDVAWKSIIGKHSMGKMNENGERLLSLCATNNLVITNTLFQVKNIHKGTWKHPRSGHWHALDHIIVRQKDRRHIRHCRAYRGVECDTDHRLLICKMKIEPPRRGKRLTGPKHPRYDFSKLKKLEYRNEFSAEVQTQLHAQVPTHDTIEEDWELTKKSVTAAAKKVLGLVPKCPNPDWFEENSDEIEACVNEKNKLFKATLVRPDDGELRTKYLRAKATVQKTTRRLKNAWYQGKAKEIQVLADQNNTSAFYKAINMVYGPIWNRSCPIKSRDDRLLKQEDDIAARWKEYYEELLNIPTVVSQETIQQLPQYPTNAALAQPPTLGETLDALKKLKSNKAPGLDGLPTEVYKYGGHTLIARIHSLFLKIWDQESAPLDFKTSLIINIYKRKGDRANCSNYRGISLLCTAGKILARIISDRLQPALEPIIPESQAGFRAHRSTTDMIFTLRQLQEKIREQHASAFAIFVDLKKAFDTVNRQALWQIMLKFGCPEKLVNIIKNLHEDNIAKVITSQGLTGGFGITNGVRQGCVLAPLLFNVFMTAFLLRLDRTLQDRGIEYRYRFDKGLHNLSRLKAQKNVRQRVLTELQYADDLVILANTPEEAQRMMDTFANVYASLGMEVNTNKTKYIAMTCHAPVFPSRTIPDITLQSNPIEQVVQFNYLGSLVTKNGDMDAEISHRIQCAASAFYKLRGRVFGSMDLSNRTKIMVFKAVVLSILLYGSECWTLYKKYVKALEKFQMRQLRIILGIKWQDFITNHEIRERAECRTMESTLARIQLRWLGHVCRMGEERIPKQILYGELTHGKRRHGGQIRRFKDVIHSIVKKAGIKENWEALCQDRSDWRNVCRNNNGIFPTATPRTASTETFTCPDCQRVILSRIGLWSHQRAHERQLQRSGD